MENRCINCKVCDGRACSNHIPGPGAKGTGDTAARNYDKWKEIRVNMDTIVANDPVSTEFELFGRTFAAPIFAGPVGDVRMHYNEEYTEEEYDRIIACGCADAGIAAFTGDGMKEEFMKYGCAAIKEAGAGVPTIKPWNIDIVAKKMKMVEESGAFAVAMDVDAAGLPFLKNFTPPAGRKTVDELKEIIALTELPFIVKGIMTPQGARKAVQAGASGIVVSNHGGRVLDQCAATAEVLEDIVREVKGEVKIFVDGGIRSGADVFKALALGADAVLIARPFATSVYYGGGRKGVTDYANKIKGELADTMYMCGASSLAQIDRSMVRK